MFLGTCIENISLSRWLLISLGNVFWSFFSQLGMCTNRLNTFRTSFVEKIDCKNVGKSVLQPVININ